MKLFNDRTQEDISLLLLRVTAGGVVFMHGLQKMFGLFGGHGPAETMAMFNEWFGLPYVVTFLVILSDSAGAFLLMCGALTRFCALAIGAVMIGAMSMVHGPWGFYMNWYGEARGEGIEFHLLVLGIVVTLAIRGGGRWSIDELVSTWLASRKGQAVQNPGPG